MAAAEENPWLQDLDLEEANASLALRRSHFAEAMEGASVAFGRPDGCEVTISSTSPPKSRSSWRPKSTRRW